MRGLAVALVVVLAAMGPARADIREGFDALNRGDYDTALRVFGELADQGDADAMFELGRMHSEGLGVTPDEESAAALFLRAARLGHTDAQVAIGYAYDFALGVAHDPAQAEEWYARAVEGGSLTALNNLAYSWAERDFRLDAALDMIKRVVAIEPEVASYLDTLGWVLFKQGKYEAAILPLCRASVLDSGHPEVALHFGDALWMIGHVARARAQWQHALDLSADGSMLSTSGVHYMGVQEREAWTAELRSRLAHGLSDAPVATPVELPRDCADLTS